MDANATGTYAIFLSIERTFKLKRLGANKLKYLNKKLPMAFKKFDSTKN